MRACEYEFTRASILTEAGLLIRYPPFIIRFGAFPALNLGHLPMTCIPIGVFAMNLQFFPLHDHRASSGFTGWVPSELGSDPEAEATTITDLPQEAT
jgi:hypothetical protein